MMREPDRSLAVLRCRDHECRERTICARYTPTYQLPHVLSMRLYPAQQNSICRDRLPLLQGESS